MRHPQYVAFVLVLTGFLHSGLRCSRLRAIRCSYGPCPAWYAVRTKDMSRFGDEYVRYAEVPAFIPRRRRDPHTTEKSDDAGQ